MLGMASFKRFELSALGKLLQGVSARRIEQSILCDGAAYIR
jgi:hypothetical protein